VSGALGAADVDAYLRRIGWRRDVAADLATLQGLHAAHVAAIPFENLDVRWGRTIALDAASLVAKLVHAQRGGYCFEQNGLFAAVLRTLGFDVRPLGARVRYRATRTLPRTHQLLLVTLEGERLVADVGFGGQTLLEPVPLVAERPVAQAGWRYRLARDDDAWVLQLADAERWVDLYAFTLEAQLPADLEMANWYVATHPQSRFVQTLTVQRATREARHVVQNLDYTIDRGNGDVAVRTLDEPALLALLRTEFALALPDDAKLPLPTAAQRAPTTPAV
jgi:N-hydroxyarylamine O-acetyltransferase